MASFISASGLPTDNGRLFYCHQCSHQWRKTENSEYVCPQCREGFIEEVNDTSSTTGETTTDPIFSFIHRIMNSYSPQSPRRSRATQGTASRAARARSRSRSPRMSFYMGFASGDHEAQAGSSSTRRLDRGFSQHLYNFDLDDFMTTFLSGRSTPVNQRTLNELPSLTITQEQLDFSCAICFDDYKLAETNVRKLPCNHLFHERCIFPWLQINGTCPVCRARIRSSDAGNEEPNASESASNFDNLLRLMRARRHPRHRANEATTSSTSAQTDSGVTTQPLSVRLRRLSSLAHDRALAVPTLRHHVASNGPNGNHARYQALFDARLENLASRQELARTRVEAIRTRMQSLHPVEPSPGRIPRLRRLRSRWDPRNLSQPTRPERISPIVPVAPPVASSPVIDLTSSDSDFGEMDITEEIDAYMAELNDASNSSSSSSSSSDISPLPSNSSSSSSSMSTIVDSDLGSDQIDLNRVRRIPNYFSDSEDSDESIVMAAGPLVLSDHEE